MTIHIELPIRAVPKGRPRFGKGFTYTPAKTRNYERNLQHLMRMSPDCPSRPVLGPIEVAVCFSFKAPKKSTTGYPRGDLDNFCKGIFDAANEILWADDSQIVHAVADKKYTDRDCIQITVKRALTNGQMVQAIKDLYL